MPVLQFKGKTAIEYYHHTVAHHTLEFDGKLSVLGKGEKPGLDGNLAEKMGQTVFSAFRNGKVAGPVLILLYGTRC